MPSQPSHEQTLWVLTNHVCRSCFGRLLMRTVVDRRKVYKCSNCELSVEGAEATCMCCCGIKLRGSKDAGIRCVENQARRPENPAVIIAEQVQPPK